MTLHVHAALARIRGATDLALPAAVLTIVALLFAPLPAALLDVGIALNLGASAAILLVTLFARDALRFASFPTLLLFTTLFRLALNVSSTRLVLARGSAGRVIEAFGRVVVDGNPVVGAVVFAILAIVQILVVAKGAERVAEVAARFTLDALPGKQMSIDADLRAGAIDQPTARARRRALERESQLYGAMDGALKFVKGDALAGILIVSVNVAGGAMAGALRGMAVPDALARYALLAIGDGLASQIPALLLAVSAGVAVTRVAGEDEAAALGTDVARQLLAEPRALAAAAALLAAIAAAPGLPAYPFLLAAGAAGALAHAGRRRQREAVSGSERAADTGGVDAAPALDAAPPPVTVELSSDLQRLVVDRFGSSTAFAELVSASVWRDRGVPVAPPHVRSAPLPHGSWQVSVHEVPSAGGCLEDEVVLSLATPDELEVVAIEARPCRDPATGGRAALVKAADATRARALAPVRDAGDLLVAEVAGALCRAAAELIGVDECQRLLDGVEPSSPALVREVARTIPPATLAEVLRRLVEEQVSIRPLRLVLQAVVESGGSAPPSAVAERCRRSLRRHIAHACGARPGVPIDALILDPMTEVRLRDALAGEHLALPATTAGELVEAVKLGCEAGGSAPVLLAPSDVRRALRQLVCARLPEVRVLSYEELPSDVEIQPVGRVALAA